MGAWQEHSFLAEFPRLGSVNGEVLELGTDSVGRQGLGRVLKV